jgi:uncharacterized protein YxjI
MALCIRERIFSWTEKYDVFDEKQNVLYSVKGEFWSLGHKIHIYDASGKEVAFIREKAWSFFKKFEIYINGEKMGLLREKFSWFHPRYEVDFMDIQVEGDIFAWDYQMIQKGEPFGMIQRKIFSWANVYYLSYPDPKNELPILALSIAIDAAHNDDDTAMIAGIAASSH